MALSILVAIWSRVIPAAGTQIGGSPVLGDYPIEGLGLEFFVGGVPDESLRDLIPITVLFINELGYRPDGLAAVHEPERLGAALRETDSNGLADTTTGAGDHGNLAFYIHRGLASLCVLAISSSALFITEQHWLTNPC